ncbi:MAG: deaminase [Hydrogenophaga sp.]|uniref:RibD family protein n=1 Tax=Hydrogenophaga sp. TaxID=1904254 RepID=UPI001692A6D6|nr:RibD family protein [Hydrogenophaga sp.]NIM42400.1 deaminase [Hydrogenophaga sp.]NIN27555.1 deaminase [Hydrogenophaga sp.]NIN32374.1 deaminase [Hydrogenophaga sp.]NIN56608.1 deaminase [Hydrogenophaga sp.]NIO52971.1 deaminase [Hydrogenophaga sp.]
MARPGEPKLQTLTDVPRDWPALWARLLAVRLGTATGGHAGPALSNGEGWRLQGRYSARSAELFSLYKPLLDARTAHDGRPWVMAQMGQSLDGFVATATGDSYYVNGAHSLLHLHRLRALCDAVLVGVGTVAIDNPQLTTRRVPGPNPVRVLFDPAASLDGHARALRDGLAPTLWLCDERHAQAARERLPRGLAAPAEVLGVPGLLDAPGDGPDVRRAVAALAARGLRLLFVEGGGVTVSRFFAAGALQRLHLAVSPVLVGQGRRGLRVPAQTVMADCPRPPAHRVALGEDTLWDLDLSGAVPRG